MKRNANISVKNILWGVALVGLGVLLFSAMQLKKEGSLRGIAVDVIQFDGGDYFLTQEDVVEEVLDMTGPIEEAMMAAIDPSTIEAALEFNPFIRKADVCISSDRDLLVTVRQRKPILRVFDSAGETYYLDHDGMRIPVSPHFTARVIVANGSIPANDITHVEEDELLKGLHELVTAIDQSAFHKSLVEQIYVKKSGDVALVPKIGDLHIEFGKCERIADKLVNLETFYTDILKQDGWDIYHSINLDYRGQVVCKKRKRQS